MSKEPETNAPRVRRYNALAGWTISVNPDGTVGVVGPADSDGGDLAIKHAGRLEQRLLHALATALVEQQPGGSSPIFVSTRKMDGGRRFHPIAWQPTRGDAEFWNTLDGDDHPGAKYGVVEIGRGVIEVVLEGGAK